MRDLRKGGTIAGPSGKGKTGPLLPIFAGPPGLPRITVKSIPEGARMAHDGPLVLKLAPLPRNQVGPFLILGVDKDAPRDAIEAAWAQRLIWARKGQTPVPLEDINWAREVLNDPDRRLRAD